MFILTTLLLRDSAPKQWKTRSAAAPACQGYCRPTRLNQADSDVTATPCINRQNIYDKWVSTNVYAMHRPLGQKNKPSILCYARNILHLDWILQFSGNNMPQKTVHEAPYTELKKVSGESCLKAWLSPAKSHCSHIILFLNRIIPSIIMFRS